MIPSGNHNNGRPPSLCKCQGRAPLLRTFAPRWAPKGIQLSWSQIGFLGTKASSPGPRYVYERVDIYVYIYIYISSHCIMTTWKFQHHHLFSERRHAHPGLCHNRLGVIDDLCMTLLMYHWSSHNVLWHLGSLWRICSPSLMLPDIHSIAMYKALRSRTFVLIS